MHEGLEIPVATLNKKAEHVTHTLKNYSATGSQDFSDGSFHAFCTGEAGVVNEHPCPFDQHLMQHTRYERLRQSIGELHA